ncbi:MAG: tetratricopeptide repeat protein [Acidobacteriota bacterium]
MKHRLLRVLRLGAAGCLAAVLALALPAVLAGQENLGRGRVTGKVVDRNDRPVAGALIVAQSLTALTTRLEARTDGKGGFVVGGMGTGPWRFTVGKSGYQDAVQDVDVHQLRPNQPLVFVLTELAAAAPADNARKEAEDNLALGNQLLAAEKYAEARELLEGFLKDHPDAYQVRLQIGMCSLKLGETDLAETELKALLDAIAAKSGSYDKEPALAVQALAGLGEAAVKRGDMEAAMARFREALTVSPTSELVAYNVAEILFANQKTDEAIQYYLMAIEIKKDWPKPYYKLGIACLNKGDYPKALEYLRKFVALDPQSQAAAEARNVIAAIEKMK